MSVEVSATLPSQYERLQVGVALYDPSTGIVLDANERFESLLGYDTERLRELAVESYSANTYRDVCDNLESKLRAAAAGVPQEFDWRIKRSDGTLIWVQVHLSKLSADGELYVLAEIRDITEYTATSRRVGLLSRIMRHNLRNDLTVIMGRAQCVDALTEVDDVQRQTEKIRQTAVRVHRMTESVREIERATTRPPRQTSLRSATAVVRETVDDLRRTYPRADITVEERTEMWFSFDEAFTQALTHAVENGIVHAEAAEPSVRIVVGESPNTGRVEVRIVDDCEPIPPVEIQALDAPGENTGTEHGTGVGLFVMKWSIEALGGEVAFERSADGGNEVVFLLPPEEPSAPDAE